MEFEKILNKNKKFAEIAKLKIIKIKKVSARFEKKERKRRRKMQCEFGSICENACEENCKREYWCQKCTHHYMTRWNHAMTKMFNNDVKPYILKSSQRVPFDAALFEFRIKTILR